RSETFSEPDPDRALARALHRAGDKLHAPQTIVDGGIAALSWLTRFDAPDIGDGQTIDIGKGLVEALGMSGGRAGRGLCLVAHIAQTRAQNLPGLSVRLEEQRVGLLLMPLQPGPAAIDPNGKRVLLASGDLRTGQDPLAAVLQPQQDVRIIVEPAPLDKGRE